MNKLLEIAHQEKLDLLAKIKSILPVEIERKINLYLSHPIADFFKPLMKDYNWIVEHDYDDSIDNFFDFCKYYNYEWFRQSTAGYCSDCEIFRWRKGEYTSPDVLCKDCFHEYLCMECEDKYDNSYIVCEHSNYTEICSDCRY